MNEFERIKLGDVGQIITGKTPLTKVPSYYDGTIHFVSPADLNGCDKNILYTAKTISNSGLQSIKGCILPKGTICVSCIGNLGYVGITTMECASNQQINSIIVDESRYDLDYIYYAIKHLWRYFKSQENQSTTISIINKSTFSNIEIYSPSLETQRKIASILSTLDDKIAVNRKICENLEAQAQALFKHWFIDFAPFKDGKFVESELGMIPEGWRVATFSEVFDLGPGGTPKTSEKTFWEGGAIPFFSPKDVNGVYCFETEKHITEKGLNNCSSRLYDKNTVFITCRGTVGKVALAAIPMAMNQSNYAILSKKGYSQYFAYLMTLSIVKKLKFKANGAVFDAITSKDFKEQIIIPNSNVVNRFDSIIKPIFDSILNLGFQNLRLATLRDTLLPKLMSGQIKL